MKPLKELKVDILNYKETKDKQVFADIIFNLDYLIRYFISKCKNQYTYLWKVDARDLYQDSIIALSNSMNSFPTNMSEAYIPCRLKAYMVQEFRKAYSYKMVEYNSADRMVIYGSIKDPYLKISDEINLEEIDYKIMMDLLDEEEQSFLKDYLVEIGGSVAMGKKHGFNTKRGNTSFITTARRLIKKRFKK
jgi:DNA-directed RNA polymerase specialized sigma24 family protein